uniref:(northern house mosquito) hypothetical protein n=1 Tax=Culex pipiens TaxID=7175 RepID=A0A8D8GVH3_CULPI
MLHHIQRFQVAQTIVQVLLKLLQRHLVHPDAGGQVARNGLDFHPRFGPQIIQPIPVLDVLLLGNRNNILKHALLQVQKRRHVIDVLKSVQTLHDLQPSQQIIGPNRQQLRKAQYHPLANAPLQQQRHIVRNRLRRNVPQRLPVHLVNPLQILRAARHQPVDPLQQFLLAPQGRRRLDGRRVYHGLTRQVQIVAAVRPHRARPQPMTQAT